MCGIVGYVGQRQAKEILLHGLEKLEYRGYDSAGIAVMQGNTICTCKEKGRLDGLHQKIGENALEGTIGIGHTRWATHGKPSVENSHPHLNGEGSVAVVHNGIIENHEALRAFLTQKGYVFRSQTDTEVIPHLIDYYYEGDLLSALMRAAERLEGSFAVCAICAAEPDKIVVARKSGPLIIGQGEGEMFVASDIPALISHTRDVYLLEDGEFAVVTAEGAQIFNAARMPVAREVHRVTFDSNAAEKGGYDHFMLKEIFEQPRAIRDTLAGRIRRDGAVRLDGIAYEQVGNVDEIFIVGCGTAYHAGLVGKNVIERLSGIPVDVDIASEFRYRHPILNEKTLLVVISQSGETADTLAAMELGRRRGAKVMAITNVVGSTVSREADFVFYTHAGPEIAVASTKAYTTQLIAMYVLALFLAEHRGTLPPKEIVAVKEQLLALPEAVEEVLARAEEIKTIALHCKEERDMFYLGRGLDYAVAMEGSLKLKEISYIHSETYAGGELKHGPIALIEEGTVVVALSTNESLKAKMASNVTEVAARGGYVIGFVMDGFETEGYNAVFRLPRMNKLLAPVTAVIPLQLLSYYVATAKGCDVDKPRNLAKSVTVE